VVQECPRELDNDSLIGVVILSRTRSCRIERLSKIRTLRGEANAVLDHPAAHDLLLNRLEGGFDLAHLFGCIFFAPEGDGVGLEVFLDGIEVGVTLLASSSELKGDAAEMFAKLPVRAISISSKDELNRGSASEIFKTDILIDAILGTGFRPPVSGLYSEAIAALNASAAAVVSVDIPSGADADVMGEQTGAVARSDAIVTFTAPRAAHIFGLLTTGPILVSPIGSPEEAIVSSLNLNVITPHDVASVIGPRPPTANKGNFGHVLVLGGSLGKAGAAAMAGMAALRAGAGLSTVATAKCVLHTVAGFHPELMTEPLEQTEEGTISGKVSTRRRIDALIQGKTVLAVGPGISRNPETARLSFIWARSIRRASGVRGPMKRPSGGFRAPLTKVIRMQCWFLPDSMPLGGELRTTT
jgi:hypothetical protein